MRPESRNDFAIAIICALPLEADAVEVLFDETYDRFSKYYGKQNGDINTYINGRIGEHPIVLCYMPGMGKTSAASIASNLRVSYPEVQLALVVGICGGVPYTTNGVQIFLGDVIISDSIIECDFGRQYPGGFQRKTDVRDTLGRPNQEIRGHLKALQTSEAHTEFENRMLQHLGSILKANPKWQHPSPDDDVLFSDSPDNKCREELGKDCHLLGCDDKQIIRRRNNTEPVKPSLHIGKIASADTVMKSGVHRDEIARKEEVIGFEMEGAGVWDNISCLVIKGVCDYSDSHKNKKWQPYAAATGASAAIAFLENWRPVRRKERISTEEEISCLRSLCVTDPTEDKNSLKRRKGDRVLNTCDWILETDELKVWLGLQAAVGENASGVLWLYGNPGTGKSTMVITMAEELPVHSSFVRSDKSLAYFFCDSASPNHRTDIAILRSLLHQLIKQRPELMKLILPKYRERKENLFTTFDALWILLMEIGNHTSSGDKYIIIDALDECDSKSQETLLGQIDTAFRKRNSKYPNSSLHFLITSRPYPEIGHFLSQFLHRDLLSYDQVQSDLHLYINEKVNELGQRREYFRKHSLEISRILKDKADGTFLWVGMACDELVKVESRSAMEALQKLPRGLHSLYQNMLESALSHEQDTPKILEMMSVVAVSQRPLSIAELSAACQLHPNEDEEDRLIFTREDIDKCRLMIIVQDEIVRFLHKSVRDFLLNDRDGSRIDGLEAHASLANRCISYFLYYQQSLGKGYMKERNRAFFLYAVRYWPHHASASGTKFSATREHENFFHPSSTDWRVWLHFHHIEPVPWKRSVLHVAARWGIIPLVHYSLTKGEELVRSRALADEDREIEFGAAFKKRWEVTPMQEAAERGQIGVLDLLLKKGCDEMEMSEYTMAAIAANLENGLKMMTMTLNQQRIQIQITKYVVRAVAENWKNGREIMDLLLDRHKPQIQPQIPVSLGIVAEICEWFDSEIIKKLLHQWIGHIHITEDMITAAARNKKDGEKMMKLLLDQCGDEIQITEHMITAAAGNTEYGTEIMEMLSHKWKGHIHVTEDMMRAALSQRNRDGLMKVLLDRPADQVKISKNTEAAIYRWLDSENIKLLLNRLGNDFQITEDLVIAAAKNELSGGELMDWLLDECGNEIKITEKVIKAATENLICRERMIILLLERRRNEIDKFGIMEGVAIADGNNEKSKQGILEELLRQQIHEMPQTMEVIWRDFYRKIGSILPDQRGDWIQILPEAVFLAAGIGSSILMNLVLSKKGGQFINSQNSEGQTPLFYAAERGNYGVAKTLLANGASAVHTDNRGYHAWVLASREGHTAVFQLIFQHYKKELQEHSTNKQGSSKGKRKRGM